MKKIVNNFPKVLLITVISIVIKNLMQIFLGTITNSKNVIESSLVIVNVSEYSFERFRLLLIGFLLYEVVIFGFLIYFWIYFLLFFIVKKIGNNLYIHILYLLLLYNFFVLLFNNEKIDFYFIIIILIIATLNYKFFKKWIKFE